MSRSDEIAALVAASDEMLLREIGAQLLSDTLGALPPSDREKRGAGDEWVKQNLTALRKRICSSETVRLYFEDPSRWNDVLIVAAVSDVILGYCSGVSPICVAALLCKRGLRALCGTEAL